MATMSGRIAAARLIADLAGNRRTVMLPADLPWP